MVIRFYNAWFMLLLIPFLAIVIGIYVAQIKKKKVGIRRQRIYLITRIIIGVLVILALSGLNLEFTNKKVTTIFVVDVSDSASKYSDTVTDYLKEQLVSKPKKNQIGIVAFGKNAFVEQFISETNSFIEFNAKPIKNATDMEAAVNYAMALMPQDTANRIVLVTDGQENNGNISNVQATLNSQNIEFNVVYLEGEEEKEVYISNLSLPNKIALGDIFSITATIESNVVTDGILHLYSGRNLKSSMKVNIQKGTNRFVFKDTQTESGTKNYRIILETDNNNDTITLNNEYTAYTVAQTRPTILVIEGTKGIAKEYTKLLDSINVQYKLIQPGVAPSSIKEMAEYKCITLVDVYAPELRLGFLDNIESYVNNYGGSVIAIGGKNSFALGMYKDTPLEKILPVNMELKADEVIPNMAMVFVVDNSGSMGEQVAIGLDRLSLAKRSIVGALENIRENDEIGVLNFSDRFSWLVDIKKAKDKEAINEKVSGLQVEGGTDIRPALAEAVKKIKKSDAAIKHIVLLTDGQDGNTDYKDVIKKINDNEITLSTVAVSSEANYSLLNNLASKGNGRAYYSEDANSLPRIFAQEIFLASGEYLINRDFVPEVVNSSNILNGVIDNGLLDLSGYIASTIKSNAKLILQSDQEDPILSTMQYGIGKTIAWNSDVNNEWTRHYAGTEIYQKLWSNIYDWALSDVYSGDSSLNVTENAGKITVKYNSDNIDTDNKVELVSQNEDGNEVKVEMKISAPGEYVTEFDVYDTGLYMINVQESAKGEVINSVTSASLVQYSREYRVFEYSNDFKTKIEGMGANVLKLTDNPLNSKLDFRKSDISLAEICLIIALILFFLDIVFRRLQLDRYLLKLINNIRQIRREKVQLKKEKKNNQDKENAHEIDLASLKANTQKQFEVKFSGTKIIDESYNKDDKTKKESKKERKKSLKNLGSSTGLDTSALLEMQRKREK